MNEGSISLGHQVNEDVHQKEVEQGHYPAKHEKNTSSTWISQLRHKKTIRSEV